MSDSEAGGGLIQEPLKNKLRRLQQGKCTVEDDINANNTIFESLLKELDTLQTQSFQLEITHQEKQELCQKLQFQCKESEQESVRLAEEIKKREELLAQLRCEIQDLKLKQRKQRMEFENHLHQLMEQHKKLYFVIKESQPKE
ncbi:synaptonemal complex central element protein 1-like isoform X1 [Entelurus aequoreus]|uniref:synaptonemal complex central element protein 1-like isoform X1 n=1 Tax=Entelurus aequoreus TaxID=161455 RepID=UPI002B1D51F5|nr:synaptonemal complex central element protein 1-like isoform X1 [Entelurus aequoreus]